MHMRHNPKWLRAAVVGLRLGMLSVPFPKRGYILGHHRRRSNEVPYTQMRYINCYGNDRILRTITDCASDSMLLYRIQFERLVRARGWLRLHLQPIFLRSPL